MKVSINPYAQPSSSVGDTAEPNNNATAVFVGAAVGNGTAYAVLFLFGLGFMWILKVQGVPEQELYARAYQSTAYVFLAHIVGMLCCLPGGYWSARLGRQRPYFNSFLAACVVAAFTFATYLMPYALPIPFWSRVVSVVTPFLGFLLGAHWWRRLACPLRKRACIVSVLNELLCCQFVLQRRLSEAYCKSTLPL
jgi:hypothetical protein